MLQETNYEDLPRYEPPTLGFPNEANPDAPQGVELVGNVGGGEWSPQPLTIATRPREILAVGVGQGNFYVQPPPPTPTPPPRNRLGEETTQMPDPTEEEQGWYGRGYIPEHLKVMRDFDIMINKLNEEYENDETSLRYIKAIEKRVYFLNTAMQNHAARRSYYESMQELPRDIVDRLLNVRLQEKEEFERLTDINVVRKLLQSFKKLDDPSYIRSNYNIAEIYTIANIVSNGNPVVKGMFIAKLFSHPFSNNWIEIKDIWQELVDDLKNKSAINTANAANTMEKADNTMEKADKSMDEITTLLKELVTNISFLGVALLLMQFGYNMWGSKARRKKTKQKIRGH